MREIIREELKLHMDPINYVRVETFNALAVIVQGLAQQRDRVINTVLGSVLVALLGLVITSRVGR